jgi:hypothetical protein
MSLVRSSWHDEHFHVLSAKSPLQFLEYRARCSFCPWSSARRSHIYKQNIFPDIPHVYIYDRSAWRARALAQSAGHRRRTSAGCFAKEIRPRPNHAKTKLFESRSVMNPVQNVKLDSWACKVVQGMTRYRASWIGLCIYIYIYIYVYVRLPIKFRYEVKGFPLSLSPSHLLFLYICITS